MNEKIKLNHKCIHCDGIIYIGDGTIIGNVPTHLFVDGTKVQMEEAVRECIEIAAKGSAFILSAGCEVPPGSPIENI